MITFTFNAGEFEAEAERHYAQETAAKLGVENHFVNILPALQALYGDPAPVVMRKVVFNTVKPFGSGIAIALAASAAICQGAEKLYYAVHKGDAYPDNNTEYFNLLSEAITMEQGGKKFEVVAPYLEMTKAEVMQRGVNLGMDIDATWSCAVSSTSECCVCEPCKDRIEAKKLIKIPA
ncbi:7-cyano-7-deazaguanine synthase [Rothia sp. ZJ1223]|uniref:7-cyano-7-deazaguanine synthase n=1 Tax=Rothia sp. ZJ1223 TaxID=2811098 RepID=UPI00195D65E8|nr:7-cyano-7-deazaguanine synthase [Rothia sp. ZJ1223]